MDMKADLNKNKKKTSRGILILAVSLLLITAAGFGGFALATHIRNENGKTASNETGKPLTPSKQPDEPVAVLNRTPVAVIYDFDTETGRIANILLGVLRTLDGKLDFIRIDTDVRYTMSATLYSELTPENTTLPQTVVFSELYRYYHKDGAFDAGRRIIGEMLIFNVPYYTAMPVEDFDRLFRVRDDGEEVETSFAATGDKARYGYGTDGSFKGYLQEVFSDEITNWPVAEKLRYLDVLDNLSEKDVTFINAPVFEKNETTELDSEATGSILYRILYD